MKPIILGGKIIVIGTLMMIVTIESLFQIGVIEIILMKPIILGVRITIIGMLMMIVAIESLFQIGVTGLAVNSNVIFVQCV